MAMNCQQYADMTGNIFHVVNDVDFVTTLTPKNNAICAQIAAIIMRHLEP